MIISVGVLNRKVFPRNFCLARGLVRLGNEVTLLTCNNRMRYHHECRDGVNIVAFPDFFGYRLTKGGLGIIDTITRIFYLLKRDFDIVHVDVGFRPSGGIPGHLYAKIKNVPYICDWWDWIGYGGALDDRSALYKMTLGALDNYFEVAEKKSADGIVTISRCLQERALNNGIPKEKTTVIHGGADIDPDNTSYISKKEIRNKLGLDQNSIILGFAGMGPHEYIDLLPFFEALPALKQNIKNLMWFSTGGHLPEEIRNRYGIGDEYHELGWTSVETYKDYLMAADILLLPMKDNMGSRARWPNKMGDYLAAGRPIISTDVGEISHFAAQFPDSVRMVQWDSNSVANEIMALISDPALMEKIGRNNLDIARNHYSWDAKAKEFDSFYRKILEGKHSGIA